jgi:hypothetical protein
MMCKGFDRPRSDNATQRVLPGPLELARQRPEKLELKRRAVDIRMKQTLFFGRLQMADDLKFAR